MAACVSQTRALHTVTRTHTRTHAHAYTHSHTFAALHVCSVKLMTERHSRKSLGYGFVEFETEEEAAQAIENLNGQQYVPLSFVCGWPA